MKLVIMMAALATGIVIAPASRAQTSASALTHEAAARSGRARPGDAPLALTLDRATMMGLERNESLAIAREALASARAGLTAARGAYDPVLELNGEWRKASQPANSSFSGAPPGRLAPEVEAAGGGVALRQLLPTGGSLSVSASGARATTDALAVLLSPAYDTQVGVELRQPLLRDLATDSYRLSVEVAGAGRDGARALVKNAFAETVAAVERSYWGLVAARLGLEVRDEAVRLAETQLDETETRREMGTVPQTELAQPRAELERRRGELLAAREVSDRAENALKLLILAGDDDPLWTRALDPVEDTAAPVVGPGELSRALERALDERPEIKVAEAVLSRRRAEEAFARDGVWPSLDAVVSYDRFGLTGTRNPAGTVANLPASLQGGFQDAVSSLGRGDLDATRVALVLGLPLPNRTARGLAAAAHHVSREAEAELIRVRKTVRAEVLDAAAALETAGQRIAAARSAREAAEIQLAAERDRYATGLSTNFLVLTRQNDLSRAKLDEISARTDYRTARTEMARATGSLLDDRGISIDAQDRQGGLR